MTALATLAILVAVAMIRIDRPGCEREIAAYVAFLRRDEAAFVTGAALAIDGAFRAAQITG